MTIESIGSASDAPDACLVRVRNHLTRPVTCAVELRVNTQTETQSVALPAAGLGEARFRLPTETGWVQVRGCARLEGGASASADAMLSTARSPHTKTALASDGRAEDWRGLPRYRIDSFPGGFFPESLRQAVAEKPGDLSAQFASQWDDQALYLRVEVTDDVHRQSQEDGKASQQDNRVGLDYKPTPAGFTAVITVPLEVVGLKLKPGLRLPFDVGFSPGPERRAFLLLVFAVRCKQDRMSG